MAVDKNQFIHDIEPCLRADSSYEKFFINFKKDGKRVNRVLDFTGEALTKKDRITKAKITLIELRDRAEYITKSINEKSYLDDIAKTYFDNRTPSNWTEELRKVYKVHISSQLGKYKINKIRRVEIDNLATSLRTKQLTNQTKKSGGCSERTIKKVITECLKPIFEYAKENKIIEDMPIFPVIKRKKEPKVLDNPQAQLAALWKAINTRYVDSPKYRSLFYFSLFGRRWGEVQKLEWRDINFAKNKYTIRAENNKVNRNQIYDLPDPLITSLKEHYKLEESKIGYVFKHETNPKVPLNLPRGRVNTLKKDTGIEDLHLHGFRHILVSALAEEGADNAMLSGMLGHLSLEIVNRNYLSNSTHVASIRGNEKIGKLLNYNNNDKEDIIDV